MNLSQKVDELGNLKAKINELKKQEKEIEDLLKRSKKTLIEGKKFRCTVSYDVETKKINWKAIAEKFKISPQLLSGNTSSSFSNKIRVSAHKK